MKQHFIPQMHLRLFADPTDAQSRVWAYDLQFPDRIPVLRAPKSCCFRTDLYKLPGSDDSTSETDENLLEATFQQLENRVAPILKRCSHQDHEDLTFTADEDSYLKIYMSALFIRNPRYPHARARGAKDEFEAVLRKSIECLMPGLPLPADMLSLLKPEEISLWPHLLLNDGQALAKYLGSLELSVFTLNAGEAPFFLPDFPVVTWDEDGVDCSFAMPISPWSILLAGKNRETTVERWNRLESCMESLTLMRFAEKFCYASLRTERIPELARLANSDRP